jgi:hypothetical protein
MPEGGGSLLLLWRERRGATRGPGVRSISARESKAKQDRTLSALMRKVRNRGFGPPCLDQLRCDRQPSQASGNANCISADRNPCRNHRHGQNQNEESRSARNYVFGISLEIMGAHASRLLAGLTAASKFDNIGLVVIVVWHGWTPAIGNRAAESVRLLLSTRQSWDTFGAQRFAKTREESGSRVATPIRSKVAPSFDLTKPYHHRLAGVGIGEASA